MPSSAPRIENGRPTAPATGVALVTLAMCASPLAAQKTDVVTLQNGNEIIGEIKQLDRGRLEYSTDDMGTVNIEWDKIDMVTSVTTFEVELGSGERFFGTLPQGAPPGSIIVGAVDPDTLSMTSVVRITPMESSFVERLSGFVDVGFSYVLANRQTTLSGSGRVRYRGRRWGTTVEGSSYFQAQEQTETITRNDLSASLVRFIGERGWSALLFGSLEQNDELNLDLRSYLGVGGSRFAIRTNSSLLRISAGILLNRERFDDEVSTPGEDARFLSTEGVVQVEWAMFRLDSPKLDLLTTLNVFPSISDAGRVRGDADLRVEYEVISDFFLGVTVFVTGDSRPPSADATKRDFGSTISLGWSF